MNRPWLQSPRYRWLILLGSLFYVLSPFDISPDFVPILGQIDDFVVLALLLSQVFRLLLGQNTPSSEGSRQFDDDSDEEITINVTAVPVDD
ncbi:MAG: YkvA family protein [Elainellaceae cyanobacterium]